MKVKVIQEFKDKYSGELHKIGKELDLQTNRINEILKAGNFVELCDQNDWKKENAERVPDQEEKESDISQDDTNLNENEEPKQKKKIGNK